MVIQLPEWDGWRIKGEALDWQVQKRRKRGGGETWDGVNFFNSLEAAIGHAYERTLRELPGAVDLRDVPAECEKVKTRLLKAVKRAVES